MSEGAAHLGSEGPAGRGGKASNAGRQPVGGSSRRSFFDVYKAGQGYHTRLGTAMAAGALVCWFAYFLFEKVGIAVSDPSTAKLWQVGVSVAVIVAFGLLGYWLLALNRKVSDFLIATEGEMKKVNWTSRKEIIGSTKVVVIMVFFMGSILFVVDMFFISLFTSIGVLKGQSFLDTIREAF